MLEKLMIIACLLSSSTAFAEDKSTLRGDILGSVLSTAFLGDTEKAAQSVDYIATSYRQFLAALTREKFCVREPGNRHESPCEKFRNSEVEAIHQRTWSRMYGLAEAAFAGRTATYNFVRHLELPELKSCFITMQLSVDLDEQHIMNDEFFARCQ
jgi:hypothetical protein